MYDGVKAMIEKEKELKEKEKSLNVLIDKAKIFKVFGAGVADVIGILVFLLVLCAFWRWNYLFSGLKKIKNNIKFNKSGIINLSVNLSLIL